MNSIQNPALGQPLGQTPALGTGLEARFAAAARHSRMVRILRVAVPAAVVLAMAGVVAVSVFNPFRMLLPKLPVDMGNLVVSGTKIASRLTRTYTDRHGLKDLVREVLNIDLSKQQQSSDWGSASLSEAQLAYAASDVLHLHGLRERLDAMLAREGRNGLAQACFDFLPTRAKLDLGGWEAEDIFAHS